MIILEKNRKLLRETLSFVKNSTNIGLEIEEKSLWVILKFKGLSELNINDEGNHEGSKLIFYQDPNDGIQIDYYKIGDNKTNSLGVKTNSEVIAPESLSKEVILKKVIAFLEEIQQDNLKYKQA